MFATKGNYIYNIFLSLHVILNLTPSDVIVGVDTIRHGDMDLIKLLVRENPKMISILNLNFAFAANLIRPRSSILSQSRPFIFLTLQRLCP